MDNIKVVWICSLSNPDIRARLRTHTSVLESMAIRAVGRRGPQGMDSAIWNTNGINEMKRIPQVELHIVSPVRNLADGRQDFDIDGIHYHFVRDENSSLPRKVVRYLFTKYSSLFKINRKRICSVIEELNPDLVHVVGAENPQYSLALLDLPRTVPTLLQLQALLASTVDQTTGAQHREYLYKAELEKQLIRRADFVGTRVPNYIDFIRNEITSDVRIVNTTLAMAQEIDLSDEPKQYDFVHYAATLGPSKATDIAIEAFALAHEVCPSITLDVIGGAAPEFQEQLEVRIAELGIGSSVTLEGRLVTHDDVISQIRKARFALLPLKVSIVPNTIHEAMANGLPVVTTETPGTPLLNERRSSVLIAPQGDAPAIAANMVRLLKDERLASELRENAALTESEHDNNGAIINHWVDVYQAIVCNKRNGTPIPSEYLL